MNLLLKRIANRNTYCIGKLYIDGKYFADTLEDTDRGLKQSMSLDEIKSKKVYSKTAIPKGTYKITMNIISSKFKNRIWAKPYCGKLPRLLNVPGYEGVLIHPGNDSKSSSGCILLGQNKVVGKVINSTTTFHKLMNILTNTKEEITITIQ